MKRTKKPRKRNAKSPSRAEVLLWSEDLAADLKRMGGEDVVANVKRMGRPTKPPKEGERVSLGLRVTAAVKRGLEAAAIKSGRSISQEAELRLEHSFNMRRHLVMAQGNVWSPIFFYGDRMMVVLGDDPRDFPVSPGQPPHEDHFVELRVSPGDFKLLRNYFGGAPYPWTHSNAEIAAAGEHWREMQDEIKRRK